MDIDKTKTSLHAAHAGMGTTNNALRDFRGRSGPFVARVRSHADATA